MSVSLLSGKILNIFLIAMLFAFISAIANLKPVHAVTETGGTILFNRPTGDRQARYTIINRLRTFIDQAPAGSTIRITTLNVDIETVTDSLVAAHKRGVNVQMVMPDTANATPQLARLKQTLGSNTNKLSFLKQCSGGCHVNSGGTMHAKLYMFSETGDKKNVTVFSSSNLTRGQAELAFNDAYISTQEDIYTETRRYFRSMLADARTDFDRSPNVSGHKLFFFPEQETNTETDFYTRTFSNIGCSYTQDGETKRTIIRFTSSLWDDNRSDIAHRLVDLKKQGCRIRIIVSKDRIDPAVLKILYDGGIETRWLTRDKNGANVHSKFIAIQGLHHNQVVSTVYAGSLNPAGRSLYKADENMTRITNSTHAFGRYFERFRDMWEVARPLTSSHVQSARPIPDSVLINPDEM